jgi:phage head maturation protease
MMKKARTIDIRASTAPIAAGIAAARAAADAEQPRLSFTADGTVELSAAGGDAKRPTFDIIGYTGAIMQLSGFWNPVIVDLSGLTTASQTIPALFGHDPDRIVGQTDAVTIDAAGARFKGTVTGENADAQEVTTQAKNGFRWKASIGAAINRREFLEAGKTSTVNGREVAGPLLIARAAELLEISFCSIPADGATSADVAAQLPTPQPQEPPAMNPFEIWLKAKGIDLAKLDDASKAALQAAHAAEVAAAAPDKRHNQSLDEVITARKKENERVDKITQIVAAAIDDRPMMIDDFQAMAQAAIADKTVTIPEFELQILRARTSAAPGAYIPKGDVRAGAKVIEAAMAIGGGLANLEKHYTEQTLNLAADRFPHGLGLRDLLVMAARENGYTGHSSSDVRGLLEAAFRGGRRGAHIQAEFSTLAIPGILSNIANKFLNAGFTAVEAGWQRITATRSVRDFKTITSYSLTGGMVYEKIGPGGELKHATLGELSYQNRADTYGKMFGITRQDIINDDLGALTDVPKKLGRGAAIKLNEVFWTEFLNNRDVFWAVGNNNVQTGGGSALTSAGLKLAAQTFRKQTDPDGKPLGISPALLLVPPELEVPADELMTSTAINTGGSSTTDKVPNRNIWAGKYQVVVSTYLSNAAFTGNSGTQWWLLANPDDLATIETVFLNGRQTPVVEQADADFDVLGIQMRGYHDFGVAKQEFRASVRSAGT